MTNLFLPYPPSTNNLFINAGKRRVKSKSYVAWQKEAQADLEHQKIMDGFKWKNHTGQVRISLLLKAPTKAVADIDNRIKAVLDLLVTNKVIPADDSRYIRSIYAEWKDDMQTGCFVVIEDL